MSEAIFIVGVQKCGTTTLASALGRLPDIELCDPKEPMLFSRGDHIAHRNMPFSDEKLFYASDEEVLVAYENLKKTSSKYFIDASTSYFQSDIAIKRIKENFPNAKIIILVRDPIKRLESAYLHFVKSGTAIHSFERELQFGDTKLLSFSIYSQSVQKWKDSFENVFVCTMESMIADELFKDKLLSFLEIGDSSEFSIKKENQGKFPVFMRLQLYLNYMSHKYQKSFYDNSNGRINKYGFIGGAIKLIKNINLKSKNKTAVTVPHHIVKFINESNRNMDKLLDSGSTKEWGYYEK